MRGMFNVRSKHPLAGKTVRIKLHREYPHFLSAQAQIKDGDLFVVEDWVENVNGKRWTVEVLGGNMACVKYGQRAVKSSSALHEGFEPIDDVVYGKIGFFGYVLHNSELVEVTR